VFPNREGQKVPQVTFRARSESDWKPMTTDEIFKGKTVVVFSLPGAFTPTCSSTHVPRYNELAPAFRAVAETGLRFDALVKPRHLRNLRRLLERHPDLKTVIDHGAKPDIAGGGFAAWADDIRAVAEGSAALCKLSGLVTEAGAGWRADDLRPTIDQLVAVFGPERLMFGSDCPCPDGRGGASGRCVARATLTALKKLAAPDVFRKIVWENGNRLLKM